MSVTLFFVCTCSQVCVVWADRGRLAMTYVPCFLLEADFAASPASVCWSSVAGLSFFLSFTFLSPPTSPHLSVNLIFSYFLFLFLFIVNVLCPYTYFSSVSFPSAVLHTPHSSCPLSSLLSLSSPIQVKLPVVLKRHCTFSLPSADRLYHCITSPLVLIRKWSKEQAASERCLADDLL